MFISVRIVERHLITPGSPQKNIVKIETGDNMEIFKTNPKNESDLASKLLSNKFVVAFLNPIWQISNYHDLQYPDPIIHFPVKIYGIPCMLTDSVELDEIKCCESWEEAFKYGCNSGLALNRLEYLSDASLISMMSRITKLEKQIKRLNNR